MKSLFVLAFSLMSAMAHAGSVDAITSILSIGTHFGTNSNGSCSVIVRAVNYPDKAVTVTAKDSTGEFTKLVEDGTDYQACTRGNCQGGKRFMQIDHVNINDDGSSYSEKILRTTLSETTEGKLYVVVAELIVIDRDSNENKVECDVDL